MGGSRNAQNGSTQLTVPKPVNSSRPSRGDDVLPWEMEPHPDRADAAPEDVNGPSTCGLLISPDHFAEAHGSVVTTSVLLALLRIAAYRKQRHFDELTTEIVRVFLDFLCVTAFNRCNRTAPLLVDL